MKKKILIVTGSPKNQGNTETLVRWFREGAEEAGAGTEVVRAAELELKANGCTSCRFCQKKAEYGCVVKDDASPLLLRMAASDVIVFATPLYFFSASAPIKAVVDRMFSLYKWDNDAGTMETALKGKTLVLIASAFEDVGLEELAAPFRLTAGYTGMKFESLLVPGAGVSGEITRLPGIREKAVALGGRIAE